jgi:hypothetical protein
MDQIVIVEMQARDGKSMDFEGLGRQGTRKEACGKGPLEQ